MPIIYLGLGSNLGDCQKNIAQAIEVLSEKISNIRTAPLYRTKPWGVVDQPDFINTAMSGTTDLTPHKLLSFVKKVEKKVGRVAREHWGPREIDIDILLYDDIVVDEPDLNIPHPGLHERDTVLQPLIDLNTTLIHPLLKIPLVDLLRNIPPEKRFIVARAPSPLWGEGWGEVRSK